MNSKNTCLCCLLRPPDKDLSTPYQRLGVTEIYSDMLEYCFQIHLTADGEEGGICEKCVGQLREACDFKLQVECSQAQLQVWRGTWRPLEDAARSCLPETDDDEMNEEQLAKIETDSEEDLYGEMMPAAGGAAARRQLAMACCVRLERLPSPAPRAPPTLDDPHSCFSCKKQFTDLSDLRHTTTQNEQKAYSCQVCYKMSINSYKIHSKKQKQIKGQYWRCDICKNKFTKKTNLAVHMRIHTGQNLYMCDVCGKLFTTNQRLISHNRVHLGDKPFSCEECNKRFSCNRNVQEHMRIHSGIKPYACNICRRQFTQKSHLVRHTRTHTKEKPYTCNVCSKTFSQIANLTQHKRVHSGERPFGCEECSKRFTTGSSLKIHKQIHNKSYTCDICKKLFEVKCQLIVHMRTHSGREIFTCNVCDRLFSQKKYLMEHNRVHTGERPFRCVVCNKRYIYRRGLNRHRRRVHAGIK